MQLPIYFFGDNHFSPTPSLSNEQKIRKLEQFIDVIENSGGSIFIMGDFFDYYFEYNTNNHNYFEDVFSLITNIRAKGIEVYFIAGNHDLNINNDERLDGLTPIYNGVDSNLPLFYFKETGIYQFGNIFFGCTSVRDNQIVPANDIQMTVPTSDCQYQLDDIVKISLFHGRINGELCYLMI